MANCVEEAHHHTPSSRQMIVLYAKFFMERKSTGWMELGRLTHNQRNSKRAIDISWPAKIGRCGWLPVICQQSTAGSLFECVYDVLPAPLAGAHYIILLFTPNREQRARTRWIYSSAAITHKIHNTIRHAIFAHQIHYHNMQSPPLTVATATSSSSFPIFSLFKSEKKIIWKECVPSIPLCGDRNFAGKTLE